MSANARSASLETFLARLFVDDALHAEFLAGAEDTARRHGLSSEDAASIAAIDRVGLELARRSFARKREAKAHHAARSIFAKARRILRRFT